MSVNKISYCLAQSAVDFSKAKELFLEYEQSLGFKIDFQDFDQELRTLDKQYSRPGGALILAQKDNLAVGCIALRRFDGRISEIKRMYVKPECRHQKIGRELLNLILKEAVELGYHKVWLDTLKRMKGAISLYQNFKFHEIQAYRYNPFEDALFLERELPIKLH